MCSPTDCRSEEGGGGGEKQEAEMSLTGAVASTQLGPAAGTKWWNRQRVGPNISAWF